MGAIESGVQAEFRRIEMRSSVESGALNRKAERQHQARESRSSLERALGLSALITLSRVGRSRRHDAPSIAGAPITSIPFDEDRWRGKVALPVDDFDARHAQVVQAVAQKLSRLFDIQTVAQVKQFHFRRISHSALATLMGPRPQCWRGPSESLNQGPLPSALRTIASFDQTLQ
jgi:hypothetical protein